MRRREKLTSIIEAIVLRGWRERLQASKLRDEEVRVRGRENNKIYFFGRRPMITIG